MKDKQNIHLIQEPDASELLKYLKNESSEAEKQRVEQWITAHEENSLIASRFATLYYACRNYFRISLRDTEGAYNQVQKKIRRRKNIRYLKKLSVGVSAAACIILFILYIKDTTTLPGIDIQEIRIEANSGMRTSVNLPDGTLVYLNSGTVITYELPFRKERKIRITGEAFFQVQKDTEKPFIVTSLQGDLDIRVTGTEFNVQAFEEDDIQTVTLVSGSVELGYQSNGSTSVRTLRPAEKAILDTRNGTLEVRSVQVENEIAWKDGRIIFKETPLPEVLKKLSYYYNVKFEVKDDIINSYSFTGTFDNRQLAQVLEYLKISSHINFTIEPPGEDDSNGKKYATVVLWK